MIKGLKTCMGAVIAAAVLLAGASPSAADIRITGAGATFPEPLYKRWVVEYEKIAPGVRIDYNGIGSGGGIKAIMDKTAAFAGSDAPLNAKELEALGGAGAVVQVPSCAGGVVVSYNVPGAGDNLNFTGELIARIFMGAVASWKDPAIAALNPGVTLPDLPITPAHRTDGSGTTYVFTNYLAAQSPEFKAKVGTGKQVNWPGGQGGKGNAGVAAVIQQTPGAIGYIESNFASANKMPTGEVKNNAGWFMKATPETVAAAGASATARLSGTVLAADLWNQPGEHAYPISSFTYLIVRKDLAGTRTAAEAEALLAFLRWATTDGQSFAEQMDYAPLVPAVRAKVAEALGVITIHGATDAHSAQHP